jgi:acetyl esterase/lipase
MVEQAERVPVPSPGAGEYLEQAMAWSDEVRATSRVALDLPYGDDERQKLDVYMPAETPENPAPVLLFFHGGYWVIGHKDLMGFMAPAITSAPALLVPVGYRLAPGAKYPQQVDDCRAALRWVYSHIADYGGDPARIYVAGHSAGGHLAALITLQRERLAGFGLPTDVIKGCFPVSGVFDVTETPPDRREAFLRSDDDARDASPMYNTEGNSTPFLLEIGSDDFDNLRSQHPRMLAALRSQPGYVEEMVREGHNHFRISLDHAAPDSPWTRRVRGWMTG